jgi:hypothetical protein
MHIDDRATLPPEALDGDGGWDLSRDGDTWCWTFYGNPDWEYPDGANGWTIRMPLGPGERPTLEDLRAHLQVK